MHEEVILVAQVQLIEFQSRGTPHIHAIIFPVLPVVSDTNTDQR